MNWKKLTLLSGVALAAVALPCTTAEAQRAHGGARSSAHVSGGNFGGRHSMPAGISRPSSHWRGGGGGSWRGSAGNWRGSAGNWRGGSGNWRTRTGGNTIAGRGWTSGSRHWRGGHHRHWRHRHYYPRSYYAYGYPFYDYPFWGASAALYYNGYDPHYSSYATNGDGENVVVQVQQELARAGYYHGAIDGVIGNGTRSAIRSYERANGLPVDGRLDTELLRAMGLA